MATTFENKVSILADLSLYYKDSVQFEDFIKFNDVGLPLAFLLDNGIVEKNDRVIPFIDETFDLFLAGLDLEDLGFKTLENILDLKDN
jgi:hypothetical protein